LYDNQNDPYQLKNLVDHQDYKSVQEHLESLLQQKLTETNDQFLSGPQYMKKWNYFWDGSDSLKT
jgi:hypothetical protein